MAAGAWRPAATVIAAARERAKTQAKEPDGSRAAQEAVTYARQNIFEREGRADERLILRDALRRGMGEATYAEVKTDFDARQKQGEFLARESRKHDSGRSFTTAETIANERTNVRHVMDGQNAVEPMMSGPKCRSPGEDARHPQSGAAGRGRGGSDPPPTGYTGCRGWPEPARPPPSLPSARVRKRAGTPSRLRALVQGGRRVAGGGSGGEDAPKLPRVEAARPEDPALVHAG